MSCFIVFLGWVGSQPPHCEGSGIILPSPAATQGVAGREGMLRQNLFIAQLPTGAMVRHPYWLPWLGTGQSSVEGKKIFGGISQPYSNSVL